MTSLPTSPNCSSQQHPSHSGAWLRHLRGRAKTKGKASGRSLSTFHLCTLHEEAEGAWLQGQVLSSAWPSAQWTSVVLLWAIVMDSKISSFRPHGLFGSPFFTEFKIESPRSPPRCLALSTRWKFERRRLDKERLKMTETWTHQKPTSR